MVRGVPVACSSTHSLDEVAGDAALRFDPTDAGDIARATETLLAGGPEIERRRQAGLAHAAAFTWERTARETVAAYREVLASTGS
jgi:glycosyltransferase involved in cell wall biosynthesis